MFAASGTSRFTNEVFENLDTVLGGTNVSDKPVCEKGALLPCLQCLCLSASFMISLDAVHSVQQHKTLS